MADPKPLSADYATLRDALDILNGVQSAGLLTTGNEATVRAFSQLVHDLDAARASRPEPEDEQPHDERCPAPNHDGPCNNPRRPGTRPEPGADLAGLLEAALLREFGPSNAAYGGVQMKRDAERIAAFLAACGVTVSLDLATAREAIWALPVYEANVNGKPERAYRTADVLAGLAALPASPAPKEHRPEWLDDVPTGYCVCGEPWQVNHARLAALKEPNP